MVPSSRSRREREAQLAGVAVVDRDLLDRLGRVARVGGGHRIRADGDADDAVVAVDIGGGTQLGALNEDVGAGKSLLG